MKDVFGDDVIEERRGSLVKRAAIAGLVVGAALTAFLLWVSPTSGALAVILFLLCPAVFVVAAGIVVLADRLWFPVRVLVQTAVVAVLFAPSILVGHGVMPAPALFVLFVDGQAASGVVSLLVTAAVALPFFVARAVRAT